MIVVSEEYYMKYKGVVGTAAYYAHLGESKLSREEIAEKWLKKALQT